MGGTPNRTLYALIASAHVAAPSIAISRHQYQTAITKSSELLESAGH